MVGRQQAGCSSRSQDHGAALAQMPKPGGPALPQRHQGQLINQMTFLAITASSCSYEHLLEI